jgi:hypothetical protein
LVRNASMLLAICSTVDVGVVAPMSQRANASESANCMTRSTPPSEAFIAVWNRTCSRSTPAAISHLRHCP